jgi:PhzF family phenazine biosynthesis protein
MKTFFVDSFTDTAFRGNPAAVCFPAKQIDENSMQQIAREIGFSETAFVTPAAGENRFDIRYFSPKQEIPLCGHATLASAKVIFSSSSLLEITFTTYGRVELYIKKESENIVMEFPVYDTTPFSVPAVLLHALGIEHVVQTSYSAVNKIILLEIENTGLLAALKPDFAELLSSYKNINGVLVTAASQTPGYDFHYRYFWPWSGTNEDPVTGGVQTFLAKYWAQKLHKNKLKVFQASERTGFMTVEWKNDKVLISGTAVVILEGDFTEYF